MSAKSPSFTAENGVWRNIKGEWRQLFGSFSREGISIEFHQFRSEKELDWSRSFHPDSLEICLNLQGNGVLRSGEGETTIGVRSVACYLPTRGAKFVATRQPGEHHHFLTVEMSRGFLQKRLGTVSAALVAPVRSFLQGDPPTGPAYAVVQEMSMAVQTIARALAEPPVIGNSPAARVWYKAKILELLSLLVFAPEELKGTDELFCDRQKRLNRERIEQVCALLERDLVNPPSLEMLATQVGCGAFHLSRTFSQHTGRTVPQYLRQLRLERAAQLLRERRCNVTEAAVSVGYSSLSHFSKAFWEAYGCCPGLYGDPKLRAAAQKANARNSK